MRVLWAPIDQGQRAPAAAVSLESPQEKAVAREELAAKGLAIARQVPEQLSASDAPQRTREQTRKDHGQRRVEPDHGVGTREHQTLRTTSAVVAIDDPGIAFDRASDALLEDLDRHERPAWTPRERVELDVRNAEPTR